MSTCSGWRKSRGPDFGFQASGSGRGRRRFHLILEHAESGPAKVFVPDECEISRTHHFAFEVDDALAATERLKELGIPIVAGPKNRPGRSDPGLRPGPGRVPRGTVLNVTMTSEPGADRAG